MKSILPLLLLCLYGCDAYEPEQARVDALWTETCTLYSEELAKYHEGTPKNVCDSLAKPQVVYENLAENTLGEFRGTPEIFLDKGSANVRQVEATIVHEMVHFIDHFWMGVPVPGPLPLICESEARAFWIEDKWRDARGMPLNGDWLQIEAYSLCALFL